MLHRITGIIKNLVVHEDRMTDNMRLLKGLTFSQQLLMKLTDEGMERQKAYELVQRNAMKVWETGTSFQSILLEDEELLNHISKKEIEEIFSLDYHFKHVDTLFHRIFS
jgi:adenylosuccinate lyase